MEPVTVVGAVMMASAAGAEILTVGALAGGLETVKVCVLLDVLPAESVTVAVTV
jgi:hypothetical protein